MENELSQKHSGFINPSPRMSKLKIHRPSSVLTNLSESCDSFDSEEKSQMIQTSVFSELAIRDKKPLL